MVDKEYCEHCGCPLEMCCASRVREEERKIILKEIRKLNNTTQKIGMTIIPKYITGTDLVKALEYRLGVGK